MQTNSSLTPACVLLAIGVLTCLINVCAAADLDLGHKVQYERRAVYPVSEDIAIDISPAHEVAEEVSLGAYPTTRDWRGLTRDTGYFLGFQFAIIGVLYLMPEQISSWSQDDKEEYSFQRWRDNVKEPVKDQDNHFINYVLHPYWGAAYYIRARERGYPAWNAFGYSVLLSTLFEYSAEALFEPVSIQDLLSTPLAGFLVGRYVFEMPRARTKSKPGPRSFADKLILVLTDPLGTANQWVDRRLGLDARTNISIDLAPRHGEYVGDYLGLRFSLRW